ncbi:MAG: septum formation initiator family protein [Fretibacterium sp.]|nr:septum formation initiator family protein [Fretibacterium sp.]
MPPLRRILLASVLLLVLSITVTYYIFEISRIVQLNGAIERQEAVLRERRENVRNYQDQVAFYKTREGIEHLAREQYNLVLPGERMILLRSPDAAPGASR